MERVSRFIRRSKPQFLVIGLFLRTFLFTYLEEIRVWMCYGLFFRFLCVDSYLRLSYFFQSPYQLHRKVFAKGGYGETPLTAIDFISRRCRLLSHDTVFDLGCGRGRSVFWWGNVIGCRAVGIDCIEPFIKKAEAVLRFFPSKKISFFNRDLLTIDFQEPTVFFLASTCFPDALLDRFADLLIEAKRGAKIITVSTPLERPYLQLVDHFQIRYPWGLADVFLQIRK